MKVAVVFVLLFATVLCRPARKVSDSSSDSSEEVVRRPAPPAIRKQAVVAPKYRAKPVQNVVAAAAAAAGSDESAETSEENQGVAAEKTTVEFKAVRVDSNAAPVSEKGKDSEDSDDDKDDDDEAEEVDEEEDESDSDSESGESSTPAPGTVSPAIVTVEPVPGTTVDTILPTIVTDTDAGRGDSLGGYPSDYKSIVYVEEKSYHKMSGPYKSYEFVDSGKKTGYDMTDGNEVEKSPKVYKAFHIQSQLLEEDTSTPEVESQGLDVSSGTSQDQDISHRQASLPEEASTTSESDSSSTPEEEESASTTSDSASASAESDDEESQSSEEPTATPGAADSDSDESDSSEGDSDEEGEGPDATTDMPAVITAK